MKRRVSIVVMDSHTLSRHASRKNIWVLIVEDDESLQTLWARALSDWGYQILLAADAEAARPLLSQKAHVALLDLHLPGASGLWLADHILTGSPTTAIVLVTADVQIPPTESLRPGVIAYLVKPIALKELQGAIAEGVEWAEEQRRRGDALSAQDPRGCA